MLAVDVAFRPFSFRLIPERDLLSSLVRDFRTRVTINRGLIAQSILLAWRLIRSQSKISKESKKFNAMPLDKFGDWNSTMLIDNNF